MKEGELKEIQAKLMRGLLDLVILQFLNGHSMHGYQIISDLRKNFGYTLGPARFTRSFPLLKGRDTLRAIGIWRMIDR